MDVVRCTFTGGPSGDWLTLFHFDRLLGGTAQDSVDTARDFWDALKTGMSNVVTVNIDGAVEIVDPSTGSPTGIDTATSRTVSGTFTGDVLPYQTQGLIYWNTGTWVGGRQVRGRTFVPAIPENYNDPSGVPSSAYMTLLANAANVFVNATICQPTVYSRTHHQDYPITSAHPQNQWAIMRTRR